MVFIATVPENKASRILDSNSTRLSWPRFFSPTKRCPTVGQPNGHPPRSCSVAFGSATGEGGSGEAFIAAQGAVDTVGCLSVG